MERREAKSKGEKERCTHLNAGFQRIARRDKKALLSDQCKEIEENNRMGKTRDLFKNIRDGKGNGNPLHYSCLENPMGRGAWKATVQGVLKNHTSEPLSLPLHGMIFKSKLTVIIKFSLHIKKKKEY